jgi:cytochrome c-type biogenesis protein
LAFFGGVISIISPCVLPIIPGFIGTIFGSNLNLASLAKQSKLSLLKYILKKAFLFSIGFFLVVAPFSLSATGLGIWLRNNSQTFEMIIGVMLIVFSVLLFFNFSFSKTFKLKSSGKFTPVLAGAGIALGWSPCLGPIMASVLTVSSTSNNYLGSVLLSGFYVGGIFFSLTLVTMLFISNNRIYRFISRSSKRIQRIAAVMLFVVGIIILFNLTDDMARNLAELYDFLGLRRLALIG